jgi:TonB family protein
MRHGSVAALTGVLLLAVRPDVGAAHGAPAAQSTTAQTSVRTAHPALLYNPRSRCPELRQAEPEDAGSALVLFQVGPTGVPSQASIKSSSGSNTLDTAAVQCVLKLRFDPATTLGDGVTITSWQQIAWKWATPPAPRRGTAASDSASAVPSDGPNSTAASGARASEATQRSSDSPAASQSFGDGKAEVRVCVDQAGRLVGEPEIVHSSGDAAFDAAAIHIARAGSGAYRLASADGKGATGCLHVSIDQEKR